MLKYLDAINRLRYSHHVDIFNGAAIRGWVMQAGRPHDSSLVAAFHEGRMVSPITPTVERSDLTSLGRGPIAFTIKMHRSFLSGVQLRVAAPGRPRFWTTIARDLRCPLGMGAVDGFVDDRLRGWAACFQPGSRGFAILVCDGDEVVAQTHPHLSRPDVADAIASDDAQLGFEVSVPWRYSAFKRLTVAGDTGGGRFTIGELAPQIRRNTVFSQSFRYRSDLGFWR